MQLSTSVLQSSSTHSAWHAASSTNITRGNPHSPCVPTCPCPHCLPLPPQEVYARPEYQGTFDAVVTCFFIDTAHNIIDYLEVIHGVLRPGGVWIHLGPLLWHWAEGSWQDLSIELSLADVQSIAQLMGFEMLQQQFVDAAYIGEGVGRKGGGGCPAARGLDECR